ncbi:MAG TPA: protease pro-enzyme activation domain-containing protein, partial [Candidatus Eisenbacteria bacterium]|nr:protease pro-enzyme activation domain-containing protein [Candidatus Eisenbacteria bacterium]
LLIAVVGCSSLSQAQTSDRITTSLYSGEMVQLKGNVHSLAKPEFDLGRADSSRLIEGISLVFHPSSAQQKDLDNFLKQLGDPTSPYYHKYLTPRQFGARFGLSRSDIATASGWLVSQGFSNIKVANNRNQIFFDGTIAQIESAFSVEMHSYLLNGVTHLANSDAPSVPAGLAASVTQVTHLNDFAPKPRAKVKKNLTSYVSGSHFLSPADFATIYDLQPLYSGGFDGTGQKIAVVGQSTVKTTDLNNFRSAAGLSASTVTMTLQGGTATECSGDEGESDLDIEWVGGVAKGAQITFVYAGLNTGDSCTGSRVNSVWDALQYAVDHNVAPFISTSYGFCESGLGAAFAGPNGTLEGWTKQAISQGQTITAASGDAGAADCDTGASGTSGLAVDAPASLPEVTGAGGNEFTGDPAGTVSGTAPNTKAAATQYWGASGTGSDVVSTALSYIPEEAWNDTSADNALSASGGGASIFYSKPNWQVGTGVPSDGKRDVPDLSVTASADHDGYLVCSTDTDATSCATGFRDSSANPGSFTVVGGTSAAAPTVSAILAIVNQYVGSSGLAPLNQTLYTLPGNSPNPFHDVTSGSNIVPCTQNSTGCPKTAPFQYGFSAGAGYDQVTGLGSIDANNFAQVMKKAPTTIAVSPSATNVNLGANVTFTATVTPSTAGGMVNFYNNSSTTALGSGTLSNGTATFSTTNLPLGSNSVTASYGGDSSDRISASAATQVNATTSFTLTPSVTTLTVAQGQTTGPVQIVVTSSAGFVVGSGSSAQTLMPVTYTCAGLPSEANCLFNSSSGSSTGSITTSATNVTLTISTTAPTAKLEKPLDRGPRVF